VNTPRKDLEQQMFLRKTNSFLHQTEV
jgi:hypothetical protein